MFRLRIALRAVRYMSIRSCSVFIGVYCARHKTRGTCFLLLCAVCWYCFESGCVSLHKSVESRTILFVTSDANDTIPYRNRLLLSISPRRSFLSDAPLDYCKHDAGDVFEMGQKESIRWEKVVIRSGLTFWRSSPHVWRITWNGDLRHAKNSWRARRSRGTGAVRVNATILLHRIIGNWTAIGLEPISYWGALLSTLLHTTGNVLHDLMNVLVRLQLKWHYKE
jgi:hypothetical protein